MLENGRAMVLLRRMTIWYHGRESVCVHMAVEEVEHPTPAVLGGVGVRTPLERGSRVQYGRRLLPGRRLGHEAMACLVVDFDVVLDVEFVESRHQLATMACEKVVLGSVTADYRTQALKVLVGGCVTVEWSGGAKFAYASQWKREPTT